MLFKNYSFIKTIFSAVVIGFGCSAAHSQNIISAGAKVSTFAPGIISTAAGEFAPTFTPDSKTVYFTGGPDFIYFSKLISGKWTKPEVASFSGKWKDMDPFLSPDGKRLVYSSYRPLDGTPQILQKVAHIWYVDRLAGDKWSAPHHLDAPVNLDGINNYAPAISGRGTLFFYSPGRDANNKTSYCSKWLGNHYDKPMLIPIKSEAGIHDPFIAADERFLVFASGGNLYISLKRNGEWSAGQKLSEQVNNGNKNSSPCISPDGKTLYYSNDKDNGILMIPINIQYSE